MKPSITSDSNNQEAPPLPNTQDKYKIHWGRNQKQENKKEKSNSKEKEKNRLPFERKPKTEENSLNMKY